MTGGFHAVMARDFLANASDYPRSPSRECISSPWFSILGPGKGCLRITQICLAARCFSIPHPLTRALIQRALVIPSPGNPQHF